MKIVYFWLETTGIRNRSKPENVEIVEIGNLLNESFYNIL